MEKVVYSLVLSKDVINAVDELAAKEGKSRSSMINHILAEYTSLSTPEKSMWDLVGVVQQNAYDKFNMSVSVGGLLTLRTTLRYRYNPAISYVLEIDSTKEKVGSLSVGMRTQNKQLQTIIGDFFNLWDALEQSNLSTPPLPMKQAQTTKQYVRVLRHTSETKDETQEGQAIASYVNLLDDCLKKFFEYADDTDAATKEVETFYIGQLKVLGEAKDL